MSFTPFDNMMRGTKQQLLLPVEGTDLRVPATFIKGVEAGPLILVAAGVHGSEFAAVQTVIELAANLCGAEIRGSLILVSPINIQGFQRRQATVLPQDGVNINSVFPGRPAGGPAERVAALMTALMDQADFYLDLHSADLYEETGPLACYPAVGPAGVIEAARRAAQVLDVPYIIKSQMAGAGIVEAARRGIPALLIKRGGVGGTCLTAEVKAYKTDVVNVLRHLGILGGKICPPVTPPREVAPHYLKADCEALWHPLAGPGEMVRVGQILGQMTDFFGNILTEYRAEADGVVLYRLQALSASTGDILMAY